MFVVKRDNTEQLFTIDKIKNAVDHAFKNTNTECKDLTLFLETIETDINNLKEDKINIEKVQDIVERNLMKAGYYDTVKHYIEYRNKRSQSRKEDCYISKIPDNVDTPWGMLGYVTYKRTYARVIDDNGTTEEFRDSILRILKACQKQLKVDFTNEELVKAYRYLKSLKCSVAGRFLWQLGTETVDKLGTMSLQNCAFVIIDEPIKPFLWIFDVLMLGTGVGFNIQKKHIDKLPSIVDKDITITRKDTKDADFIIPDSREGWVSVLEKVLEAFFYKGQSFTYSTLLIRSAGTKIKGFGGTASGPEDLVKGIDRIQTILSSCKGQKLRPIDCLDIVNIIATIVVAGNVRRCLPEYSLVHTMSGLKKIKDVNVGDYVMTISGYERVNNVFKQGKQEVLSIYTEDGVFKCTPIHRMAVLKNTEEYIWKEAKDLSPSDILLSSRRAIDGTNTKLPNFSNIIPHKLDEKMAWLCGFIDCREHYDYDDETFFFSYKFKKDEYGIALKVKQQLCLFNGLICNLTKYNIDNNIYYVLSICCDDIEIFKYLTEILRQNKIQQFINESDYDNRLAYVSGVIDNYYENSDINENIKDEVFTIIKSKNSKFVRELQTLCYSLGFETRFNDEDNLKKLSIVSKYSKDIVTSMTELVKINKIKDTIYNYRNKNINSYPISMIKEKLNKKDVGFNIRNYLDIDNINNLNIDKYNNIEPTNYCPVKVVKVIYTEEVCETYDIEVENRHEFFCEGYLTHNSALICLGDYDDKEYLKAKDWGSGNIPNWRCMSNNSIVCNDVNNLPDEFWEGYNGTSEPYGLINMDLSKKIGRIIDGEKYPDPDVEGYNPCLTGDTSILTNDGLLKINDLIGKQFEAVIDGRIYKSTEKGFWCTGNKDVYKIILANGNEIKATDNHQFKTIDGWKEVKDLTNMDYILLSNNTDFKWTGGEGNEDEGYIMGQQLLDDNKENPKNSSYNFTIGLLKGVFNINGYILNNKNKSIRINDTDNNKIQFIQKSLLAIGITNKITSYTKNSGKRSFTEYDEPTYNYILSISGAVDLLKFSSLVGFYDKDKSTKLDFCINSYKNKYRTKKYETKVISIEKQDLKEDVYDCTIPDISCFSANGLIAHNCAEISLNNFETCCLSEIYLNNVNSLDELKEIATIVYRICKHSLLLKCHHKDTENIIHKNSRIGIGITGFMQSTEEQKEWLPELYEYIREYDREYSIKHNIPQSIKLTTVKPSGTLSLLAGVTSGCHPAIYQYFIRRIRIASNNNLVKLCKSKGYVIEYQRNFDGTDDKNTIVVEFPCCYPIGTKMAKDMSAIDQLEVVKYLQKYWSDNSVSCTIYYRLNELDDIKEWLKNNYKDNVKTCSFLLHNEHGFQQAPFEEITKEAYDELIKKVVPITNGSIGIEENLDYTSECAGGVCPIR